MAGPEDLVPPIPTKTAPTPPTDGWERLQEALADPLEFQRLCWPDIHLYDRQADILLSLRDNDETMVPAGNGLGKDFVSALAALWFFCSRSPCRVVTTSVDQPQLKGVLWGEIRRFVATSALPLPIQMNDLMIRQVMPDGELEPRSYLIGRVTAKGEGLLGHHIERDETGLPRTLAIFDEASGIDDTSREVVDTWAHRVLVIGNCYPCTNFFFHGVKEGDLKAPSNGHFYRKVIKIKAEDSPNVRLAEYQSARGREPTGKILVPGVVEWETYRKRRSLWDSIRQCIGLDAEFYEGSEVLLYPPVWLDRAERLAANLDPRRRASGLRTMGVDAAEGGDSTVWAIIDDLGILYMLSKKTGDTADIPGQTLALMREWGVEPDQILFDRGGGGKQHADYLRRIGYQVRTVGFGEAATSSSFERRLKSGEEREEETETRYVYKNRRAEMYGMLRQLLDPDRPRTAEEPDGFAIPAKYSELRRQLAPIPLRYDGEGRLVLPPKNKRTKNSNEETLYDLIGRSPDDADALVLAVFGQFSEDVEVTAGAI